MKSVGEAMAVGRSFPDRCKSCVLWRQVCLVLMSRPQQRMMKKTESTKKLISCQTPDRMRIAEAMRCGLAIEEIVPLPIGTDGFRTDCHCGAEAISAAGPANDGTSLHRLNGLRMLVWRCFRMDNTRCYSDSQRARHHPGL